MRSSDDAQRDIDTDFGVYPDSYFKQAKINLELAKDRFINEDRFEQSNLFDVANELC